VKGKVVLVTGGTRGIGAACAEAFRAEGAEVVVAGRSASGPGTVKGDVEKDADRIVRAVVKRQGRLDVLVHTAGLSDPKLWSAAPETLSRRDFDRVVGTDLWGTLACARAAARAMGKRGGAIVTVGSIPALVGDRDGVAYTMAKAGVIGLTKALAVRWAPRVRVNCMAFGSIATGWVEWLSPRDRKVYAESIPLRRFGRPEDAAELAVFLARNAWVTGQTVVLDGGETRV
jgi:3-oxoacyl-[acyl-carrier protein] reductase